MEKRSRSFYKNLRRLHVRDQKDRVPSGIRREIRELDQLLRDISQAKRDLVEETMATNDALKKEKETKLDFGREMIIKALQN